MASIVAATTPPTPATSQPATIAAAMTLTALGRGIRKRLRDW
jgi:hypothetical protein